MIKEIKYNGYTATPSDYECQDGDLCGAMNMIQEDGAIHPIEAPVELFNLENTDIVRVFIHQNVGYRHFIIAYREAGNNSVKFKYCEDSDNYALKPTDPFLTLGNGEVFRDIACVGNTIIVTSDKNFYYVIWRNGYYKFLGNNIPDIKIIFGLEGEVFNHVYNDKEITLTNNSSGTSTEEWEGIYNHSFEFRGVDRDTWSQFQNIENVTLQANTEYRIYFTLPAGYFLDIVGYDSGNQEMVIVHGYSRSADKAYRVFVNTNITGLKVRVYQILSQQPTIYLTLHIDEGNTHTVTMKHLVEKTQENLDTLTGVLNHFTAKYATQKEKFVHPFFVRYAVKLYDDSYAHISAPVLMIPNSGYAPLMEAHYIGGTQSDPKAYIQTFAYLAQLQYAIYRGIADGWEDIVSGVDIFISQPIYPYNQGVVFDTTDENMFVHKVLDWNNDEINVNEFEKYDEGHLILTSGPILSGSHNARQLYNDIVTAYDFGNKQTDSQWMGVEVAPYTDSQIMEKVSSVQNFYLIHSLEFNDVNVNLDSNNQVLATEFKTLDLKSGVLDPNTLVARKRLDENMLSYRTFLSGNLFEYNNRLHAHSISYSLPIVNGIDIQNNFHFNSENYNPVNNMYVFLHTDEGDKVVRLKYYDAKIKSGAWGDGSLPWFYYPDRRAYKAQVFFGPVNEEVMWMEMELKPHDFLGGAYYVAPSLHGENFGIFTESAPTVTDNTIHVDTNVYVSEVSNPFIFVDKYTVQIGCNNIYALSAASKALSQGQFGQFPLYAFTDTGVWALEVSDTGTYIARQPITRDVLLSAKSLAQLDNAVVFATKRGIMIISGSETVCISDSIMSDSVFDISSIDLPSEYSSLYIQTDLFRNFLSDCRMLYDYTHQRIIIYNPGKWYSYVYSLKSKSWGLAQSDIIDSINSYPDCLALDDENGILDFSSMPDSETPAAPTPCILITRPIKLDLPNALKTVQNVIQRGYFNKGNVKSVLYASRDLHNWLQVRSSVDHVLTGFSGTPYKYFRILLICDLGPEESIYGCTLKYEPKMTNRLR